MNKPFDPYLEWLQIPTDERPPDHYRLLGISLFESDQRVIAEAALDVTAILRQYQLSDKADESNRLLGEVARAKACLLDPERRRSYDAEISEKLQPSNPTTSDAVSFDRKQDVYDWTVVSADAVTAGETTQPASLRFGIFAAVWLVVGLAGWGTYAIIAAHQVEVARKKAAQETEAKQKQDAAAEQKAAVARKQLKQQRAEEERERLEQQRAEEERERLEQQRAEEERERLEQQRAEKARERLEQQRAEEERRFREEQPEKYLESLGLIKRGDSWQLASNGKLESVRRNFENAENKIGNKHSTIFRKANLAEKEYKKLTTVLQESFRTSSFRNYIVRYASAGNADTTENLLNTLIDHMIEGKVSSRGNEYVVHNYWMNWARTQTWKNTNYTLNDYCAKLRNEYWKKKDAATDAKEAYAQQVDETLLPVYRKLETSIAEVQESLESLSRHQREIEIAVQRAGDTLNLKATNHQLRVAEKQKTKANTLIQKAEDKTEEAARERKEAKKRPSSSRGGTGGGLF